MHTVTRPTVNPPQPHRPAYPPAVDLAGIEAAVTAWLARHPLP